MELKDVVLAIDVRPRKFYQSFYRNDYYDDFNEEESKNLKSFLVSESMYSLIKEYLEAGGELHGEATVTNLEVIECSIAVKKLFLKVTANITNPDLYKTEKFLEIWEETFYHYTSSGELGYGETYYFYDSNRDDNRDSTMKDICVLTKEEYDRAENKNEINVGGYCVSLFFHDAKFRAEDVEYWDQNGTMISTFKRSCPYHSYYVYFYKNYRVLGSYCLENGDVSKLKQEAQALFESLREEKAEVVITDKDHNVLIKQTLYK